ncbi:hypothetical protein LFX25_19905 [Leptospira sp. FAT2]|uniref:hypothetical protein n=1 Tax=Leptospira sanjuanensis TaxID=2879643 RepID=UPI001EE85C76|nr:hypothetical protein [Leptospira sanjuanensis]MCG6170086.1 hypothetical protein [Leptospira sanjuanensis]MCG6195425.1 hypothetical protein [Leptospira sanjuanensis]MCG6195509.1 hypothetical protein [Leptospira sanjuanensis]
MKNYLRYLEIIRKIANVSVASLFLILSFYSAITALAEIESRSNAIKSLEKKIKLLEEQIRESQFTTSEYEVKQELNVSKRQLNTIQDLSITGSPYYSIKHIMAMTAEERKSYEVTKSLEDTLNYLDEYSKQHSGVSSEQGFQEFKMQVESKLLESKSATIKVKAISINPIETFSYQALLSALMISSAIVGTFIHSFRKQQSINLSNAVLGFLTGFAAYIAIIGGKAILFLNSSFDPGFFNPYSLAFLSLIAGLSSDKFFALIINTGEKKMEASNDLRKD